MTSFDPKTTTQRGAAQSPEPSSSTGVKVSPNVERQLAAFLAQAEKISTEPSFQAARTIAQKPSIFTRG